MTFRNAAKRIRVAASRLPGKIERATREAADFGIEEAKRLSSGRFIAKGEYSRRNPRPPGDPAQINVRSNLFRSSWQRRRVMTSRGRLVERIVNIDPKAKFFDGTETMIPRPIRKRVEQRVRPVFYSKVGRAIREALK